MSGVLVVGSSSGVGPVWFWDCAVELGQEVGVGGVAGFGPHGSNWRWGVSVHLGPLRRRHLIADQTADQSQFVTGEGPHPVLG